MNNNATSHPELTRQLARGWNTWHSRSVLSHVLLPQAFLINLAVKEYRTGEYLKEALIGRHMPEEERVRPSLRSWDDSYTSIDVSWKGIELTVETALDAEDLVIAVSTHHDHLKMPLLVVETGILWNRPGTVRRRGEEIIGEFEEISIPLYVTGTHVEEVNIRHQGPYLCLPLDGNIGISTGKKRTLPEIQKIIGNAKIREEEKLEGFGELREVCEIIRSAAAWNTIYDPLKDRVVSTVSRIWNGNYGGFVLFNWDAYFAALLAAIDNRDLAYANVLAITSESTDRGFVPNMIAANGFVSRDRSQPPVGAMTVLLLYKKFADKWLLEETFRNLMNWNRWWEQSRSSQGYLCWGSNKYDPVIDHFWEKEGVGERLGGSLESGLDNSPMYDDVAFDKDREVLELGDVGLMGLYVMDCDCLAEIAGILSLKAEEQELKDRGDKYRKNLQGMWAEDESMFLNVHTDSGKKSTRLSPTNFYPLLGRAASRSQALAMVREHLSNRDEFWGDWVLPSIARNDPAYKDQDYWRGRIWAPMNLLVYLGLANYGLSEISGDLAEKSVHLLLKEWRSHRYICENYNCDTGEGSDRPNSDRFYVWGALLGLIALMDAGHFPTLASDTQTNKA